MNDRIEIQGKTVEAAVSEALLQLGARRDEVEIKVLEEPKSGFMGFLGGRAAKVLVRKKRSRRRGGGRDHRQDDGDYQAHNLSGGGRSRRGGSRRKPAGKPKETETQGGRGGQRSQEARGDIRNEGRKEARDDRGGSRRGSRGRGGRGRGRDAAAARQDQDQNQNQNQKQNQQRTRRDQPVKAERSDQKDQPRGRSESGRSRNERGRRGPAQGRPERDDRSRRDERGAGRRDARPETRPVEEAPARPVEQPAAKVENTRKARNGGAGRNRRREAPAPEPTAPITQPEKKEETTVAKPIKPKRAFGGLGAKLKEKRAAEKAAAKAAEEAAKAPAETPAPSEPAVAAPAAEAPVRQDAPRAPQPRHESRDYDRRGSSRFGSGSDDEMIVEGIQATKYAKSIGAVTDENLDDALTELADGMLARAGFPCRVETHEGEYRQIRVTTDDASAGMLIGRHGQTVDAVEHLVERMASNAIDARARINLDINNYRMRREESLAERVSEAAERIRETGRAVHMEPMSARERRIVHMEAAEFGGLRTFTMDGSGGKHVVIAADEEAPASDDATATEEQE